MAVKFKNQFDVVKEHIEPKRTSVVSRLGFVSLSDRIVSMLKHGQLITQDLKDSEAMYDEQEGKWTDPEPSYDPTNDVSIDKMDAFEMVNKFEEDVKESTDNLKKAKSLGKKEKGGTQVPQTENTSVEKTQGEFEDAT